MSNSFLRSPFSSPVRIQSPEVSRPVIRWLTSADPRWRPFSVNTWMECKSGVWPINNWERIKSYRVTGFTYQLTGRDSVTRFLFLATIDMSRKVLEFYQRLKEIFIFVINSLVYSPTGSQFEFLRFGLFFQTWTQLITGWSNHSSFFEGPSLKRLWNALKNTQNDSTVSKT